MSTAAPEMTEDEITTEVEMAVGDSPAAATVPVSEAAKWFVVVEITELGFKAFCRLPNDFQHKDIREKAMAAKARRLRALKNPLFDAYDILEGEILEIAENPQAKDIIVEEILATDYWKDRDDAIAEVREREEFKTIHQDQERYRELESMDFDERPKDEWAELLQHLAAYSDAIDEEVKALTKPRREALEGLDLDVLLERVRKNRTDAEGTRAFMDTYSFWQMYAGTLKIPEGFDQEHITPETTPRERYFQNEADLREADPMIVSLLGPVFTALENNLASLTAGNS